MKCAELQNRDTRSEPDRILAAVGHVRLLSGEGDALHDRANCKSGAAPPRRQQERHTGVLPKPQAGVAEDTVIFEITSLTLACI
jgi:hypothetical protein